MQLPDIIKINIYRKLQFIRSEALTLDRVLLADKFAELVRIFRWRERRGFARIRHHGTVTFAEFACT